MISLILFITCFIINIIMFIIYKNTYDGYSNKRYKLSRGLLILITILMFIPFINAIITFVLVINYDYGYPNKIIFKNKIMNKIIEFLTENINKD